MSRATYDSGLAARAKVNIATRKTTQWLRDKFVNGKDRTRGFFAVPYDRYTSIEVTEMSEKDVRRLRELEEEVQRLQRRA